MLILVLLLTDFINLTHMDFIKDIKVIEDTKVDFGIIVN